MLWDCLAAQEALKLKRGWILQMDNDAKIHAGTHLEAETEGFATASSIT